MKTSAIAFPLFVSSLILFGTNGAVADAISLPSNQIVLLRTLIGGAFLAVLTMFFGGFKHMSRRQFLYIAASGISMGISWIFLYEAYVLIGVGLSSVLYYCGPAIVMFLSPFLFDENLTPTGVVGFAIVATGALLICSDSLEGNVDALGYVLGIGSAIAHAVMVIAGKKVTEVRGPENSSLQLILAFASVLVYSLLIGSMPAEIASTDWLPIIVLGVVNTGLGCLLYFATIPKLKAQTISIWGYLETLSAVVTVVIVLGESIDALQWTGIMLILAGTLGAEVVSRNREKIGKGWRRPSIERNGTGRFGFRPC